MRDDDVIEYRPVERAREPRGELAERHDRGSLDEKESVRWKEREKIYCQESCIPEEIAASGEEECEWDEVDVEGEDEELVLAAWRGGDGAWPGLLNEMGPPSADAFASSTLRLAWFFCTAFWAACSAAA